MTRQWTTSTQNGHEPTQATREADRPGTAPAPLLRICLVGQMAVWAEGERSVLPTGRKTRALLAILALSAPKPVLRGKLAEMLWSRRSEEQARASLRQELHRLLEALEPIGLAVLAVTRDQVALRQEVVSIDVAELLHGSLDDPAALGLLNAELLEDLENVDPAFAVWLAAEREQLGDQARLMGEASLRRESEPATVIPAAQRLLAIDRTHEGAWRALMQAYEQIGERGMAIQAFERCRAALSDQLDADPSPMTQALVGRIRGAAPVGSANGFGEAPPTWAPRTGGPAPVGVRPPPHGVADVAGDRLVVAPSPFLERRRSFAAGGGPCLGVLPLEPIGEPVSEIAPELAVADEITAALVRFRWLTLIAPSALARLTRPSEDGGSAFGAAGLDYVLKGTVQRSGSTVRVAVQLLSLANGVHVIWSGKFDGSAGDALALQDQVAAQVAAQLDDHLTLVESERLEGDEATRYGQLLGAIRLMARFDRTGFDRAGQLLTRAVAAEPPLAAAHGWIALWQVLALDQGWAADRDAAIAECRAHAATALVLDAADARMLAIAGHVRGRAAGRLKEAMTLHERALRVNPNLLMAWDFAALTLSYLGESAAAEAHLAQRRLLDPVQERVLVPSAAPLAAAMVRGDLPAVVAAGRDLTELLPNFRAAHGLYLSALGHLGDVAEAARVRARLIALAPGVSLTALIGDHPFERPSDRIRFAQGLQAAGLR